MRRRTGFAVSLHEAHVVEAGMAVHLHEIISHCRQAVL